MSAVTKYIIIFFCCACATQALAANKPAPVPVAVPAPVIAPKPAPKAADSLATMVRLPDDDAIRAKLDSISQLLDASSATWDTAAVKDSSARIQKAMKDGKYIARTTYDKSNFDHWRVDSILQAEQKKRVVGDWRTDIMEHGHAFLDATLRFENKDTLSSTTYTYADSARYLKTGEYAYKARYRFESDSTFRSREVFSDRNVVRWDYVRYKIKGDTLRHHLYKLEFRDLMDNWLDAIQEFDQVSPEVYHRTKGAAPDAVKPKERS